MNLLRYTRWMKSDFQGKSNHMALSTLYSQPSTLHSQPSTLHSPLSTFHIQRRKITLYISLLLLGSILQGCVRHKQLVNFYESDLPIDTAMAITNQVDLTIQPQDLLYINVHSLSPEAAAPFNLTQAGQGNNQMSNQGGGGLFSMSDIMMGYLVDDQGNIDFPVLGSVQVKGKTTAEAQQILLQQIKPFLSDAVIDVRFLNFRITVLGEVNQPGTYRLSAERITVLDAIGAANDMTVFANRRTILVIREENAQRSFHRLDLNDPVIFTSPYFYLRQNDVLYIEPHKTKIAAVSDPLQRVIGYFSAGLSIVTLIFALSK